MESMQPPCLRTLIVGAFAAVLALVSITGCSKSSDKASSKASSAPSTKASTTAPALTQNTLPPASAIVNDADKRKAVAITKCAASDGGWSASGSAKNSGPSDTTYAITVFFTDSHATVQDFATTSVTVKAGQTQDWSATKKFAAANPTLCVLRGVG
jgi:hypothetical protein